MASLVDKNKPKVVMNFGPTDRFLGDGKYLFFGTFPLGDMLPVDGRKVVENPRGVNNDVILAVVD
jgi:hypothetical protein